MNRDDYAIIRLGELADVAQAVDALGPDIAEREDVRRCRAAVEALRRVIAEDMGARGTNARALTEAYQRGLLGTEGDPRPAQAVRRGVDLFRFPGPRPLFPPPAPARPVDPRNLEVARAAMDVPPLPPPGRTCAPGHADPPAPDPAPAPADTPLSGAPEGSRACEACGGALGQGQVTACSPACRARASRDRARARRLDAIDRATAALAEAREEIERG